jgi:hypothetical protein
MTTLSTSSSWWIALDANGRAVRVWAQRPEALPPNTELVEVAQTDNEDIAEWTVMLREFPLHVVERVAVPVLTESPTGLSLVGVVRV